MKQPEPLKYVAFEDKEIAGEWRVEAIDTLTGGGYIAIFAGLDSEYRANEYAAIKNGKHPGFKPAGSTNEKITITLDATGQEVSFAPETLSWSWKASTQTICGKQKPLVELSPKGKN